MEEGKRVRFDDREIIEIEEEEGIEVGDLEGNWLDKDQKIRVKEEEGRRRWRERWG